MCGYCSDDKALDILESDVREELKVNDLGSSLYRYFYLRETPAFTSSLDKLRRDLARKQLPFFSEVPHRVLLCRGLEILMGHGFHSQEYQILLKKPLYRDAIVSLCSRDMRKAFEDATEGLGIEALGTLYDAETYFWGDRSRQLCTLATILPACRNLLKHYISWWLDGNGLHKDEYCASTVDDARLSLLFRTIYFSILVVGSCSAGKKMMQAIIEKEPATTPSPDGDVVWLQRVAALKLYDLEGFETFRRRLPAFRHGHYFHVYQHRGFSDDQKQMLLDDVVNLMDADRTDSRILMSMWLRKDLGLNS
jgi:hypothetical protein